MSVETGIKELHEFLEQSKEVLAKLNRLSGSIANKDVGNENMNEHFRKVVREFSETLNRARDAVAENALQMMAENVFLPR